jgi:hypothetical protein
MNTYKWCAFIVFFLFIVYWKNKQDGSIQAIGDDIMNSVTGQKEIIEKMANAIKTFEGWNEGSTSYRNNNPGNLKFANQNGAIGKDERGHAIFSSYEAGWNALIRQITAAFNNTSKVYNEYFSLYEFFSKYAEMNSVEYAQYVANQLGVDPNITLKELKG